MQLMRSGPQTHHICLRPPQLKLPSHCATKTHLCRSQKAAQRDRAALLRRTLHRPDPLLLHITDRLLDRLEDCLSKFPTAVILGGAGEVVAQGLANGRAGVERVIHMDTSPAMLELAKVRSLVSSR
jgi:hypothetical protein